MISNRIFALTSLLLLALVLCGVAAMHNANAATAERGGAMALVVTTTSFPANGAILRNCTCDGADASPDLAWSGVPAGVRSFALIADDPDAPGGTWTHWTIWNIPAQSRGLPKGVPKQAALGNGTRQGMNDFPHIGYGGPCPPPGKPHRYFFKLFALDVKLDLRAGAGRHELDQAMKGHVLAQAELMGRYGR